MHAARRRSWSAALLMTGRIRSTRLRYMDSLLGRLREAGFPAETTYAVYHVLDAAADARRRVELSRVA